MALGLATPSLSSCPSPSKDRGVRACVHVCAHVCVLHFVQVLVVPMGGLFSDVSCLFIDGRNPLWASIQVNPIRILIGLDAKCETKRIQR